MLSIMVRLDNHKTTLEELLERVSMLENWRCNLEERIDDRKPGDTAAQPPAEQGRGL
jgi:hypothetical protein